MNQLTPEQKAVGQQNYNEAVGVHRRSFMKEIVGAGLVAGAGLGAHYFGYSSVEKPVRVGIIGTGDEGNVLIGACNPKYVQVVAISDIRPYNIHRAFYGDWASPTALAARPGLMRVYGWQSRDQAGKEVKVYENDYHDLLKDPTVEAVIIALPLHLHAKVAVEAMQAGKHVLTEKLMAHNVAQCKVMAQVARELDMYLATGHQRHYSVLYDNAVHLLKWGILGEVHHIRAQWHRGNLPGKDSWQQPIPGGEMPVSGGEPIDVIKEKIASITKSLKRTTGPPSKVKLLEMQLQQWNAWDSDKAVKAEDYDYRQIKLSNGRTKSAMEELCRWRLWARTGGGLMAELGSHQLDAASIFCTALRRDKKKARPLTVHALGGRHVFPLDRDAEDHVYCMFEFPGPGYDTDYDVGYWDPITGTGYDPKAKTGSGVEMYPKDPNKKIVVSYSSIMGNGYGGYGEIVMGSKGTLILEREKEVMLYAGSSTSSSMTVKDDAGGPSMDTQASGDMAPVAQAAQTGPVSRGYMEEIEHWAWCIRNKSPENQPRCRPQVALGDAVIAMAANVAIRNSISGKGGYLPFQDSWYDIDSPDTPDGSDLAAEKKNLGA